MSNKPVVLFCFSPLPFFPLGLFIIVGNASKKASVRCCDNLKGTNTEGEQEKKERKKNSGNLRSCVVYGLCNFVSTRNCVLLRPDTLDDKSTSDCRRNRAVCSDRATTHYMAA